MKQRHRRSGQMRRLSIPRHAWVLLEVLVTVLVLHYSHISMNELVSLLRMFL